MSERWKRVPPAGEPELDAELSAALRALDPATDDATYWLRFRAWVVESAAPELARRRLAVEVTVGDVLTAWARTLVPTALMAAALAGVLVVRDAATPPALPTAMSVEELLTSGLEDEDPFLSAEAPAAIVFASEHF